MTSPSAGDGNLVATSLSPGTFIRARSKTWIVEDQQTIGGIPTLDLVSVETDSQGETLRVVLNAEIGPQVLDPNDWSPLLQTSFEGPERLGAYLRATDSAPVAMLPVPSPASLCWRSNRTTHLLPNPDNSPAT